MPFDMVGFSEAAPGTGTVNVAVGLAETQYRVVGDDLIIKEGRDVALALWYAAESTPGHARLTQPGKTPDYQFLPSVDLNDPDFVGGFSNHLQRPLKLIPKTKLNGISVNATDEDTIIGVLLGSGPMVPYAGMITHKIRGSADKTLTANTWTSFTPIWDFSLPEGHYNIVGLKVGSYISSGFMLGLARLIMKDDDAMKWRPGVPLTQLAGDKVTLDNTANHPWEKWGLMPEIYLTEDNMPDIEILTPAALTDHACELELVKTA